MTSCGPKTPENPLIKGVIGQWHLTSWSASMPEQADVYVEFKEDNTFVLYQKDWNIPIYYVKFTGTYLINDTIITGQYSDGKSWGATSGYTTTLSEDGKLTMVNVDNTGDVSVYTKVTAIPSEVVSGATRVTVFGEQSAQMERYL